MDEIHCKKGLKTTNTKLRENPTPVKRPNNTLSKKLHFIGLRYCDLKGKPKEKNRKGFCGPNPTLDGSQ
jgi:hypothetical protein